MNLVKNSIKFTKKGSIAIKACFLPAPDNLLVIHVKDTGTGIEKEDFLKVFTRFGKLQRTAEINNEGLGLGLNIVKSIVEKSGGFVNIESEGIGHGSNFSFSMKMEPVSESDEN